jgi:hypothetical protein
MWLVRSFKVQILARDDFDLDHSNQVRPNRLDKKLVQKAAEILSTESVWSRKNNWNARQLRRHGAIYCAIEKAKIDVTGGFHHRRPAREVVREIVEQRTASRQYQHRLMDYNNDPVTHLSDE